MSDIQDDTQTIEPAGVVDETEPTAVVDELDTHNGEPLRPTVVDGNGIERIAGPPVEGWKPAQIDPTDEQLAANQRYQEHEAARRDIATELLSQPTSEPLQEAQADYHNELDNAAAAVDTPDPTGTSDATVVDETPEPQAVDYPDPVVTTPVDPAAEDGAGEEVTS